MEQVADPLKGRRALVTGAGRMPGRFLARLLAAAGAEMLLQDLAPQELEETAVKIRQAGGKARTLTADIGKGLPLAAMLDGAGGEADILVHALQVQPGRRLAALDEWEWQRCLELNLSSAFLLIQALSTSMKAAGRGSVVIVLRESPLAEDPAYAAALGGLTGLLRACSADLREHGVGVFGVTLGEDVLEMLESPAPQEEDPARRRRILEGLRDLLLYLCSPQALDVSGQILEVSGVE